MPDDNMPGGETFIRQMQYGKGYYRDKLGVDVTSGWLIDTFGHHAQLPQLLAKGGFKTFWFVRGVPRQDFPVRVFLGRDRRHPDRLDLSAPQLRASCMDRRMTRRQVQGIRAVKRFNMLSPNSHGPDRVGLSGPDVAEPEDQLDAADRRVQPRPASAPSRCEWPCPPTSRRPSPGAPTGPVWKGELNPIFQGIYSSRIELKAWMRLMEEQLLTAEKLSVLAAWLGSPADLDGIWAGWEPVLFNQTHDLASGVMTDHVYEDTIRSYEFAKRRAEAIIDAKWDVLTSKIDTRGPGAPSVVFNTLGWPRSDIAELRMSASAKGGAAGDCLDRTQTVPSAVSDPRIDPLRRRRSQDGSRRVHRRRCAGIGIFDVSRLAAASVTLITKARSNVRPSRWHGGLTCRARE